MTVDVELIKLLHAYVKLSWDAHCRPILFFSNFLSWPVSMSKNLDVQFVWQLAD